MPPGRREEKSPLPTVATRRLQAANEGLARLPCDIYILVLHPKIPSSIYGSFQAASCPGTDQYALHQWCTSMISQALARCAATIPHRRMGGAYRFKLHRGLDVLKSEENPGKKHRRPVRCLHFTQCASQGYISFYNREDFNYLPPQRGGGREAVKRA